MDDLISRQAALDAMETWDKFGCDPDGKLVRYDDDKHYIPYVHYEDMVHAIKHLPSAQPERKKGRWLRYGEDGYPNNEDTVFWQCDQCLEQYTGRTKRIPNFCPNCGADMRKGE